MKQFKIPTLIGAGAVTASIIVGLSGCGNTTSNNNTDTATPSTTKSATPSVTSTNSATTSTSGARADTGNTITFGSSDATEKVDCASGKSLNVAGDNNTLTVTGSCVELTVGGSGNTIGCDQVDESITVVGSENKITCKGGQPAVLNSGNDNSIQVGANNTFSIMG